MIELQYCLWISCRSARVFRYFFSDDEGKRDELLEKMGHMWDSWMHSRQASRTDSRHCGTKLSRPRDPSSCRFKMWAPAQEYIYFCAREKHLKRVYLAQVGGGAFSFLLGGSFDYATLRAVPCQLLFQVLILNCSNSDSCELDKLPALQQIEWGLFFGSCAPAKLRNRWNPWKRVIRR